jgi:hypothetical protein
VLEQAGVLDYGCRFFILSFFVFQAAGLSFYKVLVVDRSPDSRLFFVCFFRANPELDFFFSPRAYC